MRRPRPLDPIRSLKAKWSIVILAAVAVTGATSQVGFLLGWPVWVRPVIAGALALAAVQVLAHGMILPLREMALGAAEMRTGVYRRRVQVSARDEIGQLAASFNQMAADLAEVDRLQKEFVANASHELRTPVAALRGQIENLADGVVEASPALFGTMQAQAEHLSKLVTQLLDLSRLEAGAGAGPNERCDLADLLHQVAEEALLLDPDVAVTVCIDDLHGSGDQGAGTDESLMIDGDDARLHQLFTNLVGNAVRFTADGEGVVVTARRDGPVVVVEIRDRGPGIAPEHRTRVFERFWQADGATPTGGGGAGLGLALCKRIVDRHDGSIRLDDNAPDGTCVTVSLPASSLSAPAGPALPAPPSSTPTGLGGSDDLTHHGEERTMADSPPEEPPPNEGPPDEERPEPSDDAPTPDDVTRDGSAAAALIPLSVGPTTGTLPPPPPPDGPPLNPLSAVGWSPPGPTMARSSSPLPELTWQLASAIGVTAVLAGFAIQIPGASLALTGAALGAALILLAARSVTSTGQVVALGLLAGCGAVFSVRDSPWVTTVEVLAVSGLAWLLAVDGLGSRRPRSWMVATGESCINLFDWVPWWLRSSTEVIHRHSPDRSVAALLRAVVVGFVVVLWLGILMASGDVVFGHVVSELFGGSWITHLVLILLMAVPSSVLALTAARSTEPSAPELRSFRVEALTSLWATALMLMAWCGIQVVVATGGADAVLAAEGVTVADYAREGFFQLVAVAAVALTVVHVAHRVGGGDRIPVSAIGLGLAVLISISYSRLAYYVDAFGLTMLRLSVATFLAWLAVMTVASVVRAWGVGADRHWLPSAAVLTAGVLALVYGAADPEAYVLRTNLLRADTVEEIDLGYLSWLSDDARVAALDYDWSQFEGGRPAEIDAWICEGRDERGLGVLGWNLAHAEVAGAEC